MTLHPNVIFVFSDQHRYQATGFAGDPNVKTPVMDRLAKESINFTKAVSCAPVCSPYRGSLLTGQYPLTHGVFVNDVNLAHRTTSLADAFNQAGYETAYIGKWHVDGHGRSRFIPPGRQLGFKSWQVLECTHEYNHSIYYEGSNPEPKVWTGYDAEAQTAAAQTLIRQQNSEKPFLLVISWGPPHNPYETAPERFQKMYSPAAIHLRPNVPVDKQDQARIELSGYYAHISALDECLGKLLQTIEEEGIAEDTLFVYTSDHGDMLWSQGEHRKQRPWDESILTPFLLRYPRLFRRSGKTIEMPINTPDIMPTLLSLCGLPVPSSVEGKSYAGYLTGEEDLKIEGALIECVHPFGEWTNPPWARAREYRGLRSNQYTYVRDLNGPWMLYDNLADPYQMNNLIGESRYQAVQTYLESLLSRMLIERKDEFLPGLEYMHQWNYPMDETGTVPIQQ